MAYVYRLINNGFTKDFATEEELIEYLKLNLCHPCFLAIKSFEPEHNIVKEQGFAIGARM